MPPERSLLERMVDTLLKRNDNLERENKTLKHKLRETGSARVLESTGPVDLRLVPAETPKALPAPAVQEKGQGHNPRVPQGPQFSAREMQVGRMLLQGLTRKEIARDLNLSPNTIKVHISGIYRKLDINDMRGLRGKRELFEDDEP